MGTRQLTELEVRRLHREGRPVVRCDGNQLYFRKQSPDVSSWVLRYARAGRQRWFTLGNYPDMSLADARQLAREKRVLIDKGKDPMEVKRAEIAESHGRGSFGELCEAWYENGPQKKLKHPEVPRRHLDKYLLPALGRLPASDVGTHDVLRVIDRMKAKKPAAANDLLRFAKRIFDFGVKRQLVASNPISMLTPRDDAGGTESPRQRTLSRDELARLFKALRDSPAFGPTNLIAVKLLLALCVRKGELFGARWNEFDLDGESSLGPVWRLPSDRTKTETNLDIPLAPHVVEWLRALKTMAGDSEFVLPKRRHDHRNRVPHIGIDTLNAALAKVAHGLEPFTVHDFRRTARTFLASLGVRHEVAERCLGHKLKGVAGTYNTHDYFEERRAALTQWAGLLHEIERGARKITPIRRTG